MSSSPRYKSGDLVRYVFLKRRNKDSGKLGFILKISQHRSPYRSDVYWVKFQNEEFREIDERWLEKAPDDHENESIVQKMQDE